MGLVQVEHVVEVICLGDVPGREVDGAQGGQVGEGVGKGLHV